MHRFEHTNLLFHRFGILKFTDLVRLRIVQIVHEAQLNVLPPNLQNRLMLYKENEAYTLTSYSRFETRYVRTTKMSRCISVEGIKIYHSLPFSAKSVVNSSLFKKKFKTVVFNSAIILEKLLLEQITPFVLLSVYQFGLKKT